MEKIHFKMSMSDGAKVDTVGIQYKTKNGINVALHKRGNLWYATELSTGKAISTSNFHGVRTMKEAKAGVEELSPIIANLLKSEQPQKQGAINQKPRKDKPVTQGSQKSKSTNGAKKTGEAAARSIGANTQSRQVAPTAPKSSPSFTVMAGRKSKTFATKKEAKAYEKAVRGKTGKPHKIRESTRKPTHRLVSFTAKK